MERRRRKPSRLRQGLGGSTLALACGLLLWLLPQPLRRHGQPIENALARVSFDLPTRLAPALRIDDLQIITLDEGAYRGTGTSYGAGLDRRMLAGLVNQLQRDGCPLIVFDVWLADVGPPAEDRALAEAIRRHGRVVLAADIIALPPPLEGQKVLLPRDEFVEAVGTNWGISRVPRSVDSAIRRHYPGTLSHPSLPWAAAALAGASVTADDSARWEDRWIRYYGSSVEGVSFSYTLTTNQLPGFFRGKTVFIGGRPQTRPVGEVVDVFPTPLTGASGDHMAGVDIQATIFLNLMRGDWLRRVPWGMELLILAGASAAFGFTLGGLTPGRGIWIALAGAVLISLVGIALPLRSQWWFAWMIIVAGQIPTAWAWSLLSQWRRLAEETQALAQTVPRPELAAPAVMAMESRPADGTVPEVPDHALLCRIGKGAFGEVWLGRNAVGLYHAVKVVFRREFQDAAPFEREFHGIRKFMPVSLEHPGWVRVLHVGRNDAAGFFYYVMELGDDMGGAHPIDPATYDARTLETDRRKRGRLPLDECVEIGTQLAEALEFLHAHQLVHRDIKPGNVIFVNGRPKFADIGLVTEIRDVDETRTQTGSPGYTAPDGAGTAVADVFSLGRLLYVLYTGLAPEDFPELPRDLGDGVDVPQFFRFNEIVLKACEPVARRRYQTATELKQALLRWKR